MGNNSTCIEWLKTMDIVIIVAVIGRAGATPARSAIFDCRICLKSRIESSDLRHSVAHCHT